MGRGKRTLAAAVALTALCGAASAQGDEATFAAAVAKADAVVMGDPVTALEQARLAQQHSRGITDGLARALWLEAEALARLGRGEEAMEQLARARRNLTDTAGELAGNIRLAEARVYKGMGKQGVALNAYHDAHDVFAGIGADYKRAVALHGIASLYLRAGRHDRAIEINDQALAIPVDDPKVVRLRLAVQTDRGRILRDLGRDEEATAAFAEALTLSREIGAAYPIAINLLQLANQHVNANDTEAAARAIEEAEALSDDPNAVIWQPFMLYVQGQLAVAEGDEARATARFAELFEGYDFAEPQNDYHEAHQAYADHAAAAGDFRTAFDHMNAYASLGARMNEESAASSFDLLQAEFDSSNRELEIERLRSQQLALRGLVAIGLLCVALASIGLLTWYLRATGRARDALARTNDELVEAMNAKTAFLAATSHEIRTPLNAVIPLAEVVLSKDAAKPEGTPRLDAEDRGMIEQVVRSGKLLLAIVNDILDVAKMQEGNFHVEVTSCDVAAAVSDAASMHRGKAKAGGLDLVVDAAPGLPRYDTDERLVWQAVSNLVGNAVKFTERGQVRVETRPWAEGFEVRVRDTGIGIPADKVETVFEAFSQVEGGADRKYGGTGLGLALVKEITDLLGGSVWAESTVGIGTLFTLRVRAGVSEAEACPDPALPATPRAAEPAGAGVPLAALRPVPRAEDGSADLSQLRVLVAEDNKVNQMVITAQLGGVVALLEVAEDGHEALAAVQERSFDVVLMDNQMPGLSGIDATRAIRQLPGVGQIPIIAVTADIAPQNAAAFREAGMNEVVAKPLDRGALLGALSRVFGEAKLAEQALG